MGMKATVSSWFKTEPVDESVYEDPPEGFQDWPVLDRIEWNMDSMRKRITIGTNARRRLAKVVRAQRVGFLIFAILTVLAFAGIGNTAWENRQNAIAACESVNKRITGTRADVMEQYERELAGAKLQGYPEGGAILQYYADYKDWRLNELYPYRDCENLDKQIKIPGEPPSFNEAIVEVCEQQPLPNCDEILRENDE